MKILTAAEMKRCDRVTGERFGVSQLALMQAAGGAVAQFAARRFPAARLVTVLCGRGNNGGDGMVAARLLARHGCAVRAVLLGESASLPDELAAQWRDLDCVPSVERHEATTEAQFDALQAISAADLIVDAVVGTGFRPPLRGLAEEIARRLRASNVPVLAVDLPSGWDADSTDAEAASAFPADAVVTFTAPKPAHVFGRMTRHWSQPVVLAAIGSPVAAVVSAEQLRWAGASKALAETPRAADSNKGRFGHVLVAGGSIGKSGAPAMTSLAALRAGAGLVTAAVPEAIQPLVASIAPELMTMALDQDARALIDRMTVLAIGPGLGTSDAAKQHFRKLIEAATIPVVVDADGLNLLAAEPEKLREIAQGRPLILTPHPGEMARLARCSVAEVQADRLGLARRFATENHLTLVLKGWRTLIAHPDGEVAVNTTGNPGMAKAGSGDVLTGIVAGMVAQHPHSISEAVEAAVYLHGLAGDLALCEQDEHTLLATDLIAALARAFRSRSRDPDGFCWLQGLAARLDTAKLEVARLDAGRTEVGKP